MKRSKLIVFYLVLISFPILLNAQSNSYGTVTIASPTAAALGKYADIPVSYHTGIPQISIPLYTVKAGSLELPIGLSYHASGLKVIETASWVGAGWSLDAGGVITRTVMGLPDEKNTGSGAVDIYGYYTDSGYNKYLYQNVQDQDWQGFSAGRKDGEPDLFFFNFGGYSGKFFFRDDHTPILVPQQDIQIIPYFPSPGTQSIQGFTIITPDGNQYLFGNTPNVTGTTPPVEITTPYSIGNGYSSGTAISSWYLNKIVSYDGVFSINLTYTAENYGYYTLSNNPLDPYSAGNLSGQIELGLVKNIISGVKLSQITFPNGKVDFIPGQVRTDLSDNQHTIIDNTNTIATSLGSIKISNNDSSFCKKYVFSYGYFVDNITTQPTMLSTYGVSLQTDKSRLRLDSVKEETCDNLLQIPARRFTYFSEMVPRRLTLALDHWGFFNGVTANQTLIPTYSETTSGVITNTISGANRDASWPAMRGGSLNKMTYPTGGSTVFDFEPADNYTKPIATQQMVNLLGGADFWINTSFNYADSETNIIYSNGSQITLNITNTNTQDWLCSILIRDSTGATRYQTTFGNNGGQQLTLYPPPLGAGTYWLTLSINPGAPNGQGVRVNAQQLTYITQTYNIIVGGLRIKTITQKDSINNSIPIITSYTYPNGGYLYSFPTYVQHIRNDLVTNLGYWDATNVFLQGYGANNGCPLSGSYYVRSGGSLRPMATTQGYHIGFPVVNVSQSGNGYSQYVYHTTNGGFGIQGLTPGNPTIEVSLGACESTTPNYPAAPLPFDYLKGELYYERHFNQNGDLLKDAYYYPGFDTTSIQPAPAFIVASRTNANGQILFGTLYNVFSVRKDSMHTVETNYSPGLAAGVQQDTYIYYGSPYHNHVTRKVTTTSNGDNLLTKTLYAPDFHSAAWDISPSCETTYSSGCGTCLTSKNYRDSVCAGNDTCMTNSFLTYRKCLSDARNSYVNSRFTNYTGVNSTTGLPNNNYATNHASAKTNAGAELKPILDLQDENRVVPIEIADYRDSSLLKANFTRYDYMPYPSSIPFPNKTQLVSLANPSSTFTSAVISGTNLTKDSRYLDESTYGFLGGNVAKVTGHDGLNSIYIWDYKNTNPIAKTISATTDSTAFSSFEADGTGNWNLSTGGGNTSQVSVAVNAAGSNFNLFTTQTPTSVTENDHMPTVGQEVGVKFTSSAAGTITGIRFYKTSGNTGTHIGELYSSTGTRLAQATFTGETSTGWQTVSFTTAVSITANTTYTAAYFSSLGNYTEQDNYFLNNSVTNTPLTAAADGTYGASGTDPGSGQGTFIYTSSAAFPNQLYKSANYWVDVIFSPSTTPYANAGVNQSITLPLSSVVLNGSGSTGSVTSYNWTMVSGPSTPVIVSPTSTFTTVTGLTQGVYVFQLSVNSGASTSQVTINVLTAGTPTTIFTTQATPTSTLNDGQALEVGVKFRASTTGSITGIRFYKTTGNTGTHIGELYSYPGGIRLGQASFTGETTSGWQTVTFSSPISITANTTYVAAYWSGSGNYPSTSNYYANAVTNGPLTALADGTDGHNSIYGYSTVPVFPTTYTTLFDQPNYWVDVMFVASSDPVPNAGNNLNVTLPVSSVTLSANGSIGTISNYLWTKVSGPGSPVIVSPTSAITNITGLSAGSYVFQLATNGASNAAYALTGTKSYNMVGNTISKSGLTSGKKYIVSYWTRGSACSIAGGTSTSTTGRSVNGWTYYEHTVTMTSTTVTITGSSYIDELRLYPQGAQMSSYTYRPVVGITTMNDPNSEITYYEYDGLERLKNIKDYQGNIVKNYQYNYVDPNGCGANCQVVTLQTFSGTNPISYPVGVFNINGKLLGNASNQAQYITTWMSDTADSHTGTIIAGADSMHFNFNVNAGRSIPNALTGCRYYQIDLPYTQIDAVHNGNADYVDYGDGTGMRLGSSNDGDTNVVKAPNTIASIAAASDGNHVYWIHSYPDSSTKTLTFYHNDFTQGAAFDNYNSPSNSTMRIRNFRGNLPQQTQEIHANCYQNSSALTVSGITNWNSISTIGWFILYSGDYQNTCLHVSYAQDFMANNKNLQSINTTRGYYLEGYEDSTFRLSRLKSNWNTYFTNLNSLVICEDHWNREDLSALINLNFIQIIPGNTLHSFNPSGNPLVPLPTAEIDNIINQIAAGAGQYVSNGSLYIYSAGPARSTASDAAVATLKAKGWLVSVNFTTL